MKKLLLIAAAIAIAFSFSSCKKDTTYGGDYSGTYTFFKLQNNQEVQNGDVQKNRKVSVRQLTDNQIYLYGFVPLEKSTTGVYVASEVGKSLAVQLLSTIGAGSFTSEQINNINVEATFSGSHLSYRIYYEIQLAGVVGVDVNIMKFDGDKQ